MKTRSKKTRLLSILLALALCLSLIPSAFAADTSTAELTYDQLNDSNWLQLRNGGVFVIENAEADGAYGSLTSPYGLSDFLTEASYRYFEEHIVEDSSHWYGAYVKEDSDDNWMLITGGSEVVQFKHAGTITGTLIIDVTVYDEAYGDYVSVDAMSQTAAISVTVYDGAAPASDDTDAAADDTSASDTASASDGSAATGNVGSFTDVAASAWYANAVAYAVDNGLFSGTSATTFAPNGTMTRAMFVTVLARMNGADTELNEDLIRLLPAVNETFTDLDIKHHGTYEGDALLDTYDYPYYYAGLVWAEANGIVSGTSATTFSPNAAITREQIATILYRYLSQLDMEMPDAATVDSFVDAADVSGYAAEAVEAMREWGFVSGTTDGRFNPKAAITRAEAATILMRVDYYLKHGSVYGSGESGVLTESVGLTLNRTELTLFIEQPFYLIAYAAPATAENTNITWKSSNEDCIIVMSDGKVLPYGYGSAVITATDAYGHQASAIVTVTPFSENERAKATELSEEFAVILNQERVNNGLDALAISTGAELDFTILRSYEQVVKYGHTRPLGGADTFYDSYICNAENAGWDNGASDNLPDTTVAEFYFDAWMNSPGHKAALMSDGITEFAVACYVSPDVKWIVFNGYVNVLDIRCTRSGPFGFDKNTGEIYIIHN